MGTTRYYNMAFFDFGDQLDTTLNVQKEIDRFVLIDKQIYGLYNIFSNGVISGWDVADAEFSEEFGITVDISAGIGIINFIAAETDITSSLINLPPNSLFWVYAVIDGQTVQTRKISFVISITEVISDNAIKLAQVSTGDSSVVSIDNTVRNLINFEQEIHDQLIEHRHRGDFPKIDLRTDVKNQLPGARMEGFDSSKITSGVFNEERIPLLDHNNLKNNGLLTHAALDTFVRSFSQTNKELLGEISTTNLLKQIIFLKYKFDNENTTVDEHFINELALIPGISPNSFIDFNSSTANISLIDNCISGLPAKVGRFESIYWNTQAAFVTNYSENNVVISNGEVSLANDLVITDIIENFEEATFPGQSIPGFIKTTTILEDGSSVVSDGSDTNKVEGFFSGGFTSSVTVRTIFTKKFIENKNWTDFNQLVLEVKTIDSNHDDVIGYFTNIEADGSEKKHEFVILDIDEITFNANTEKNNFEQRVIDITNLSRNSVKEFVIYTDETSDIFKFYLDNIYVRRENLIVPEGYIRFRHTSLAEVVYYSLSYEAETPDGTEIEARVKVASSSDLLSRSSYTLSLQSGDIFGISGTDVEIEIKLLSTSDTLTPVLKSVDLKMLVDADFNGYDIDTEEEFSRGTLSNIETSGNSIQIEDPINVDGLHFGYKDIISEVDDENIGIYGFSGVKMPISPKQALNWENKSVRKFNGVNSVIRRYNKHFLIADKNNHRVVEVNSDGSFIKGFASTYSVDSSYFYPITSCYNPITGILTIVFTGPFAVNDITKILLNRSGSNIPLVVGKDVIYSTDKCNNKVLEISLSIDNRARLSGVNNNLFINFQSGAFTVPITKNSNAISLYSIYGIEVFIGDYTYVSYIRNPIFVNILTNNDWVVANSSINYILEGVVDTDESVTVVDLIEFNPDNLNIIFSSDKVKFSDYSLGSVLEFSSTIFVVAGIYEDSGSLGSGISGSDLLSNTDVITDNTKFRASALDNLSGYRGGIFLFNKPSSEPELKYQSPDGLYPSDVDLVSSNGRFLVAESSIAEANGRIINLDEFFNITFMYGLGNFCIINSSQYLQNGNIVVSV